MLKTTTFTIILYFFYVSFAKLCNRRIKYKLHMFQHHFTRAFVSEKISFRIEVSETLYTKEGHFEASMRYFYNANEIYLDKGNFLNILQFSNINELNLNFIDYTDEASALLIKPDIIPKKLTMDLKTIKVLEVVSIYNADIVNEVGFILRDVPCVVGEATYKLIGYKIKKTDNGVISLPLMTRTKSLDILLMKNPPSKKKSIFNGDNHDYTKVEIEQIGKTFKFNRFASN